MHIYTVVLDYAGGTFVSQCSASDADEALRRWLVQLQSEGSKSAIPEEVVQAFGRMPDLPVPLVGLSSAWCANASAPAGLATANIIQTAA